jgi:2-polyprenyl-3-methyl-5-hydroxy-6-metoxy-1,4-benzoquinol methylase
MMVRWPGRIHVTSVGCSTRCRSFTTEVRPGYPDELFADLVTITGMGDRSSVLEVGCGTGQATRSLAALGCSVTALEPGAGLAALARRRMAAFATSRL